MDLVAGRQRPGDHAVHHAREHLQMFRAGVFRFAEVFRDRAADGLMHPELKGASADAVDAE